MTRRHDVVGIGLAVYDTTHLLDPYPEADTKVDAVDHWHGGGGPVPNTLAALARWDVSVAYIGRVGDDLWGRAVRDAFAAAAVDVSHLELDPSITTPVASIWVDRTTGARTAVLGFENYSPPRRLPSGVIENSALLHLDGRDPGVCVTAAQRARHSGVGVSLDVGSPRRGALDVLPFVDHLVVADRFARFAARVDDGEEMLTALWKPSYAAVVVTRGARGAVGCDARTDRRVCGIYPVDVIDTTGAGDVYHAGYIYGVLQGWSLERRMTFAAAAAALASTALGARGCLPARGDVEALARTLPSAGAS